MDWGRYCDLHPINISYVCPPTSVVSLRLKQTLAAVPLYTGSSKQEMELFKQEIELFNQEMELFKQEMEL